MLPIWIGVQKIDNVWYKLNRENLTAIDITVTTEGDQSGSCMVLDYIEGDFKGRIVSCDSKFNVSLVFNTSCSHNGTICKCKIYDNLSCMYHIIR